MLLGKLCLTTGAVLEKTCFFLPRKSQANMLTRERLTLVRASVCKHHCKGPAKAGITYMSTALGRIKKPSFLHTPTECETKGSQSHPALTHGRLCGVTLSVTEAKDPEHSLMTPASSCQPAQHGEKAGTRRK